MSRHGYQEDLDQQDFAMWRGRVASAIRGKRGQKLIRELADALDAMPEKRLIARDLVRDGDCCALGAVCQRRNLPDLQDIDPEQSNDWLADTLDIAECLVQEIEYENDEGAYQETPEQRWVRMRRWCEKNLVGGGA